MRETEIDDASEVGIEVQHEAKMQPSHASVRFAKGLYRGKDGKTKRHPAHQKKKLDPVGQEDPDVDNDGDVDNTDNYLHARRKKVQQAIIKHMTSENAINEKGGMAYKLGIKHEPGKAIPKDHSVPILKSKPGKIDPKHTDINNPDHVGVGPSGYDKAKSLGLATDDDERHKMVRHADVNKDEKKAMKKAKQTQSESTELDEAKMKAVAQHMDDGKSDSEIAMATGVSKNTIKALRKQYQQRLGVQGDKHESYLGTKDSSRLNGGKSLDPRFNSSDSHIDYHHRQTGGHMKSGGDVDKHRHQIAKKLGYQVEINTLNARRGDKTGGEEPMQKLKETQGYADFISSQSKANAFRSVDEAFRNYTVVHKPTGKSYKVTAMTDNDAKKQASVQHGGRTASRYTGTNDDDFHIEGVNNQGSNKSINEDEKRDDLVMKHTEDMDAEHIHSTGDEHIYVGGQQSRDEHRYHVHNSKTSKTHTIALDHGGYDTYSADEVHKEGKGKISKAAALHIHKDHAKEMENYDESWRGPTAGYAEFISSQNKAMSPSNKKKIEEAIGDDIKKKVKKVAKRITDSEKYKEMHRPDDSKHPNAEVGFNSPDRRYNGSSTIKHLDKPDAERHSRDDPLGQNRFKKGEPVYDMDKGHNIDHDDGDHSGVPRAHRDMSKADYVMAKHDSAEGGNPRGIRGESSGAGHYPVGSHGKEHAYVDAGHHPLMAKYKVYNTGSRDLHSIYFKHDGKVVSKKHIWHHAAGKVSDKIIDHIHNDHRQTMAVASARGLNPYEASRHVDNGVHRPKGWVERPGKTH